MYIVHKEPHRDYMTLDLNKDVELGATASLFFIIPKEQLIAVYVIQKRRGIAITREFKRMVYQTTVSEEK